MASILTDPPTTKSLGSNNAPQRLPITVATFEPRQYAACSKAVLVPTWYGFNYNTCKLQYTIIACTEIVTPTTCPPSRRASPPTIPPPTQPRPEPQDHVGDSTSGLTNGEVAGITIASAVLLILLLALAVWFYRIIQREKKPQQPLAREYDGSGRERRDGDLPLHTARTHQPRVHEQNRPPPATPTAPRAPDPAQPPAAPAIPQPVAQDPGREPEQAPPGASNRSSIRPVPGAWPRDSTPRH